MSSQSLETPILFCINGCEMNWPTNGKVTYYVRNFCDFICLQLKSYDMAVVFNKLHVFSIKFSTRVER